MKHYLRISLILFLVVVGGTSLFASAENLFIKANEAYRNADYQQAIDGYLMAIKEKPQVDLFYNLGNAAFKLNRIGEAILNYERARKLDPRNEDVLYNLKYAESLVEYRVEDKRVWHMRVMDRIASVVSARECQVLFVLLYFILISIILLHWVFAKRFGIGRIGVFVLTLLILNALVMSYHFYESHIQKKAVITAKKVDVRFGPSADDRLAFSVGEGVQVSVDDESNGWYRINLASKQSGWVERDGVEIV